MRAKLSLIILSSNWPLLEWSVCVAWSAHYILFWGWHAVTSYCRGPAVRLLCHGWGVNTGWSVIKFFLLTCKQSRVHAHSCGNVTLCSCPPVCTLDCKVIDIMAIAEDYDALIAGGSRYYAPNIMFWAVLAEFKTCRRSKFQKHARILQHKQHAGAS